MRQRVICKDYSKKGVVSLHTIDGPVEFPSRPGSRHLAMAHAMRVRTPRPAPHSAPTRQRSLTRPTTQCVGPVLHRHHRARRVRHASLATSGINSRPPRPCPQMAVHWARIFLSPLDVPLLLLRAAAAAAAASAAACVLNMPIVYIVALLGVSAGCTTGGCTLRCDNSLACV